MTLIQYDAPETVSPGYIMQEALGLDLKDSAGAPIEFARFRVEPGRQTVEDCHEEAEIWFILRGSGELQLDNKRLPVREGAVFSFRPDETHTLFNTGDTNLEVITVYWFTERQN